jgi:hypothetical protein
MSSYPMGPAFTLAWFVQVLQRYGVELRMTRQTLTGPGFPTAQVPFLVKGNVFAPLLIPMEKLLTPYEVRSICSQLGLDPRDIVEIPYHAG